MEPTCYKLVLYIFTKDKLFSIGPDVLEQNGFRSIIKSEDRQAPDPAWLQDQLSVESNKNPEKFQQLINDTIKPATEYELKLVSILTKCPEDDDSEPETDVVGEDPPDPPPPEPSDNPDNDCYELRVTIHWTSDSVNENQSVTLRSKNNPLPNPVELTGDNWNSVKGFLSDNSDGFIPAFGESASSPVVDKVTYGKWTKVDSEECDEEDPPSPPDNPIPDFPDFPDSPQPPDGEVQFEYTSCGENKTFNMATEPTLTIGEQEMKILVQSASKKKNKITTMIADISITISASLNITFTGESASCSQQKNLKIVLRERTEYAIEYSEQTEESFREGVGGDYIVNLPKGKMHDLLSQRVDQLTQQAIKNCEDFDPECDKVCAEVNITSIDFAWPKKFTLK